MNDIEQGGVILVDEDDDFLAGLLVYILDKVLKAHIGVGVVGRQSESPFILTQYREKVSLQLVLLHVLA